MPTKSTGDSASISARSIPHIDTFSLHDPDSDNYFKFSDEESEDLDSSSSNSANLPNEILHWIFSILAHWDQQGTLARCCLVNKNIYSITSPLLWKHLRLSPWKNQTRGQVLCNTKKVLSDKHEDHGSLNIHKKSRRPYKDQVRTLSLYYHSSKWCCANTEKPLHLPNLHTLHLYLDEGHGLHTDDEKILTEFYTRKDVHGKHHRNCRILRKLRPKVIILHNACITEVNLELACFPDKLFKEVETLFFISDALEAALPQFCDEDIHLPKLRNLERVYWMFHPTTLSKLCTYGFDYEVDPHSIYPVQLVEFVKSIKVPFTLINAGSIGRYINEDESRDIQHHQDQIEKQITVKELENLSSKKQAKIRSRINFVTFQEFIDEEHWWEYVAETDLDMWEELMVELEDLDTGPYVDRQNPVDEIIGSDIEHSAMGRLFEDWFRMEQSFM